jgi:hypothetical protein
MTSTYCDGKNIYISENGKVISVKPVILPKNKYKVTVTLYEGNEKVYYQTANSPEEAIKDIKIMYYGTTWQKKNKYKAELIDNIPKFMKLYH